MLAFHAQMYIALPKPHAVTSCVQTLENHARSREAGIAVLVLHVYDCLLSQQGLGKGKLSLSSCKKQFVLLLEVKDD